MSAGVQLARVAVAQPQTADAVDAETEPGSGTRDDPGSEIRDPGLATASSERGTREDSLVPLSLSGGSRIPNPGSRHFISFACTLL